MTARPTTPRIWRVLGDKKGDNGQVEIIAEAMARQRGWPSELRHLAMTPEFVTGKPRVGPTLYHLDPSRSDALEPPWPDLILTIGRRPSNAALWIKQQSGGKARIVKVGKPSGWLSHLDLVVASAETLLAPFDNVLRVDLPLMQVDPDRLVAGQGAWRAALDGVPRPLVAFLIGGPTVPFVFDAEVLRRMRARIRRVLDDGGTPYVVGSRRTPEDFIGQLCDGLPEGIKVFDWASPGSENPYTALLALADRFVVTGDSISMQVEVARLGKPLEIVPLPTGWLGGLDDLRRRLTAWLFDAPCDSFKGAVARALYRIGLVPPTRHLPRFHRMLVSRGLARWVDVAEDDAPARHAPALSAEDDMQRILARIDRLVAEKAE